VTLELGEVALGKFKSSDSFDGEMLTGSCEGGFFLHRKISNELKLLLMLQSQNHRMLGVGRDLCGSSSPTPLRKKGHPEQAAQDLVQAGLEYLQRRRLHNLSGQPVAVLHHYMAPVMFYFFFLKQGKKRRITVKYKSMLIKTCHLNDEIIINCLPSQTEGTY